MPGATQAALLGFTSYTVDAISWLPIRMFYAYRPDAEGLIENTGAVTINLRTLDTDSTHERALLSGVSIPFKVGSHPRGTQYPPDAPICYAKAASGTAVLVVTEW